MADQIIKETFFEGAEAWICDGYSQYVRFIASADNGGYRIWDASINLYPLPAPRDLSFLIDSAGFVLGQIQCDHQSKKSLLALLCSAASGVINLPDRELVLTNERLSYFSEMSHRDRWFSELHLQVIGGLRPPPSAHELAVIDNTLRKSTPPFDGLVDAAAWLDLSTPGSSLNPPVINIKVGPPADLIYEKCILANDRLRITLHAHPALDVQHVGLAVRAMPGDALESRRQIAKEIRWDTVREGRREGTVEIELKHADNVLTMLIIGSSTARRQWFLDPAKARNNRLLAVQHFDKDLRMIRQAVTELPDASKFENGVAALLFLLGFSPCVQLETDSPDLIVSTPGGRLVIVECTIRVADVPSKIGKLVDRRGALTRALQASGHPAEVACVLACRLPRDQIATHREELRAHKTILVAGEDFAAAFERVRFPIDPDLMLQDAQARLAGDVPTALS